MKAMNRSNSKNMKPEDTINCHSELPQASAFGQKNKIRIGFSQIPNNKWKQWCIEYFIKKMNLGIALLRESKRRTIVFKK